jgi:hypothetical protein
MRRLLGCVLIVIVIWLVVVVGPPTNQLWAIKEGLAEYVGNVAAIVACLIVVPTMFFVGILMVLKRSSKGVR